MSANAAAMQAMAVKYMELARIATDPIEREKLLQYATLYREFLAQALAALRIRKEAAES